MERAKPNPSVREGLQAQIAEVLQPGARPSLQQVVYEVTTTAAQYADLVSPQDPPHDAMHQSIVAEQWSTYVSDNEGRTNTYPIRLTSEPTSLYAKHLLAASGLKLPVVVDRYLLGARLADGNVETNPASELKYKNKRLLAQIQDTPSDHPQATTIRNALVVSQVIASTATYIRDYMDRFTELGRDAAFLPRKLRDPNVAQSYWEEFFGGQPTVIGVFPGLDCLRQYGTRYRRLIESAPFDTDMLNQAIISLTYLHTSKLPNGVTAESIRQPIIEALLQLDMQAVSDAYESIASSYPELLLPETGSLIGLNPGELAELQQAYRDEQEANEETSEQERQERELARQSLFQIRKLNKNQTFCNEIYGGVRGKTFDTPDGTVIRIGNMSTSRTNEYRITTFRLAEDGGPIQHRNGWPFATTILRLVMTGEWSEHQ